MKKLLALLALAGFTSAFAQSTVSLFGNMDQGLYTSSYSNNSMTTTGSNVGSTSYWGIRGNDNLGGGTTASFELRSEITLNSGTTGSAATGIGGTNTATSGVFNRGAWLALTDKTYGEIKVGRMNDLWWENLGPFSNTGINSYGWNALTAAASGANTQHLLYNGTDLSATGKPLAFMGSATSNVSYTGIGPVFVGGITYATPTINGFSGKIQTGAVDPSYTTSQSNNNSKGYSIAYDNGKIYTAWAVDAKTDSTGARGFTQNMLGVAYKFGNNYTARAATSYTGFGSLEKAQGAHEMRVDAIGLQKVVGRWDYNFGITKLTDVVDTNNSARGLGVTARYNFSKQTSWYVGAGQMKNTGLSRLGPVYNPGGGTAPLAGDYNQTLQSLITGIRFQF